MRGGLSGKARRARHKNRVARIQFQQNLEEYDTFSDDSFILEEPVPVRHRKEFLATDESGLDVSQLIDQCGIGEAFPTPAEPASLGEDRVITFSICREETPIARESNSWPVPSAPKALLAGYVSPSTDRGRDQQTEFSLGRFLYGCALGGAAAAILLLMVHIAIR